MNVVLYSERRFINAEQEFIMFKCEGKERVRVSNMWSDRGSNSGKAVY